MRLRAIRPEVAWRIKSRLAPEPAQERRTLGNCLQYELDRCQPLDLEEALGPIIIHERTNLRLSDRAPIENVHITQRPEWQEAARFWKDGVGDFAVLGDGIVERRP